MRNAISIMRHHCFRESSGPTTELSRREARGRAVGANEVNGCLPTHVSFAAEHVQSEQRPWYHALPELLGEPDEQSFGAADVAEPIRVLVLHHFANELRAALAEPH